MNYQLLSIKKIHKDFNNYHSGRLANTMLVYAPHSEEFRTAAYENVYIFIGMSAAVVIIHLVQVKI